MDLRSHREALGISQSRLARLSGVSRFKICTYELGSTKLNQDDQSRIRAALTAESDRLRQIRVDVEFGGAAAIREIGATR